LQNVFLKFFTFILKLVDTIDYIIFIFYVGLTIFLGLSFIKKNKDPFAFIFGKKQIPEWVITLSIIATYISSISFIALPASAYSTNWNAFVFSLSIPITAIIAKYIFVPLYRNLNITSAYTFLEHRFGFWARLYTAFFFLMTQLMRSGTILYLIAIVFNTIFNWPISFIIIFTGLIVLIYSLFGGIQAVVWTDALQAIILIIGAIITPFMILISIPGGLSNFINTSIQYNKFSLGSFHLSFNDSTFWVVLIYGIFINLQNFGIDQNYIQRYLAASDDKAASRSAFNGSMLYIPISFFFFVIGSTLFVYYHNFSEKLPSNIKSDFIFPYFIANEMPHGLIGLLTAAIFAAGMSTLSTSFNSGATVLYTDFFKRLSKTKFDYKNSMKLLYLGSSIIGIGGILIALAMINVKNVLDTWWKLASIFSGGMLGLFLLAAFIKNANKKIAVISTILGLITLFILSTKELFFKSLIINIHPYIIIVVGTLVIFLTGTILSFFILLKRKKFINMKSINKKK